MKKTFTLVVFITMASMVLLGQTVKDPQQELNQLQQKVRSLQGSDQKIRTQLNELQKAQDQARMEVGVSMKQLDSLTKATRDSLRVANSLGRENSAGIDRISSSMILYKILAIIAVLLSLGVIIMLFSLRSALAKLKEEEDQKIKEEDEKLDKSVVEMIARLQKSSDELGSRIQSAEIKMNEIRGSLSQEISGGLAGLKQELGQVKMELKAELDAQVKKHDAAAAESGHRFTELGARFDASLGSVRGELLKLEDKWKKDLASEAERLGREAGELKKSLQAILKNPKDQGN